MLTNWLIPHLAVERHDHLFQQDGAPPHWHLAVLTFLNEHLPNRWIGHAWQNDQVFCKWPPRSPDLTVCDFFLWGYVKDRVYVPPLPATVDELREHIAAAVNSVTPDMLQRAWSGLDYCIDVSRVTKGGHIGVCVCDTTWNYMSLCNCSRQFCKNIAVSFDIITTWNQGVFLCSPYIIFFYSFVLMSLWAWRFIAETCRRFHVYGWFMIWYKLCAFVGACEWL